VLNRLAYGPRPGEIEAVMQIGARAWIENQLHPERIADATGRKLQKLPILKLSQSQLMLAYRGEQALGKERRIAKEKTAKALNPKEQKLADDARQAGFQTGMGA